MGHFPTEKKEKKMTNQKYTAEFRCEAVKLALESDDTYRMISDNLGINYKSLTQVNLIKNR